MVQTIAGGGDSGQRRKLLEFRRSPNAVKVRVALNYKRLEYQTEEMMSANRAPLIEAAGWPLIPVLLDGPVVMRDSAAILHYLECNYRDRPGLTPPEEDDVRTAETLLVNLNPEVLRIQWTLMPEIRKDEAERDLARVEAARERLVAALERLDGRLAEREWLVGDAMSMYDVILACNLLPSRPPASFIAESPLWRFFGERLAMAEERPNVVAWVDRVTAWES